MIRAYLHDNVEPIGSLDDVEFRAYLDGMRYADNLDAPADSPLDGQSADGPWITDILRTIGADSDDEGWIADAWERGYRAGFTYRGIDAYPSTGNAA